MPIEYYMDDYGLEEEDYSEDYLWSCEEERADVERDKDGDYYRELLHQ